MIARPLQFRRCLRWSLLLACFVALIFTSPSIQAAPQGAAAQPAANEVTEFTGKLKSVRGNVMTITRDDDVDVMVMMPDSPAELRFIAKALPAYLRRGMLVRFETNIGPTGMPLTPVTKLTLFAPVNTKLLSGHQRESFMPGVHPRDPANRGKKMFTGKATVVGNLMMLTPQGGLAIQVGRQPMQTMVAPDATIELQVNDLSLAQPGDTVKVAGFYQPPDDTKVKGDRVTITTDRVYGEPPKKPARRSRRTKTEATPADEDAE